MELFETSDDYIVLDGDNSLWCSRRDGRLTAKKGSGLISAACMNTCLGNVYGVIGKIAINSECEKLLLICRRSLIGQTAGGHDVFAINRIAALPLLTSETPDLGLEPCKKHHFGMKKTETKTSDSHEVQQQQRALPLKKTWNSIKTVTSQVKYKKKPKDFKDRDKFERRVTDELVKMFMDTESFYFSRTADLTNSVQRQWKLRSNDVSGNERPLWRRVDDRFFWNCHMLRELINSNTSEADHWIVPVIQGFVQIQQCTWDPKQDTFFNSKDKQDVHEDTAQKHISTNKISRPLGIIIISRRSRYRAGTRYRRRGVDESGKVANYVETEQIVEYEHHVLSFVQVRGSVPVYWSQPGYKYRPPPRLDKGEEETQNAFEKHFAEELGIYDSQAIVSLVEQNGKEKVIADAYLNHILKYDDPKLTYIAFDFHEYCRGMRFDNVSVLILSIQDVIRDMVYCWTDKEGVICEQRGTFRVNCIDCLDRTNVVQTALAKAVLEIQFTKIGVVPPEGTLPYAVRNALQVMWANNGDSLSRQYAGTAALKGDYTRTGERRLAGMVKDGYNSANRYFIRLFRDLYRQASICLMLGEPYLEDLFHESQTLEFFFFQTTFPQSLTVNCITYNDLPFGPETHLVTAATALARYYLNRFKDAYRQAAIDLMLGKMVSEDDLRLSTEASEDDDDDEELNDHAFILNQSEHVKQLVEDCKKMLVPESEVIMGGWALIDADPTTGDPNQQDADMILILTRDSYYVVNYDDETDRITNYQKVLLKDVEKIELGPEPSFFKCKYNCMRINYIFQGQNGYFHMLRSTNVRFFNNMAIVIKSDDEALESLKAICDACLVALEVLSLNIPFCEGKLERKKNKTLTAESRIPNPLGGIYLDIPSLTSLPRNVSEGQLMALKHAGTKAISNVTSHFAKFNTMVLRSSFKKPHADVSKDDESRRPSTARPQFHVASSSDSEDEESVVVKNTNDVLLESCGILASRVGLRTTAARQSIVTEDTANDHSYSAKSKDNGQTLKDATPEIHISSLEDCVEKGGVIDPTCVPFKKTSHSAESIKTNTAATTLENQKATSTTSWDLDVELSMKTSHSESAIHSSSSSPPLVNQVETLNSTKDHVLSPFSKLAKGVQSFGINLHRATHRNQRSLPPVDTEAQRNLRDRCLKSRTRIIQL